MKLSRLNLIALVITFFVISGCTYRLVDFTVISTKNAEIGVDRSLGVKTEGSKAYFLGLGWNLEDALDIALESAGRQYDLLIDGVVSYQTFPFITVVKVRGMAVSSSELKSMMGEKEFEKWCNSNNIFNPSDTKTFSINSK